LFRPGLVSESGNPAYGATTVVLYEPPSLSTVTEALIAEIRAFLSKRSATIAFAEIDGLAELAERWGHVVAEAMFVKLAGTLAHELRSNDSIARVAPTRFGILLTETNEIAAINFVERARSACEAQRGLAANILRIGFGWASLTATNDLPTALELATRRLAADLAQP
jgi:diguanylate cyclase (GGDEF)-like protein